MAAWREEGRRHSGVNGHIRPATGYYCAAHILNEIGHSKMSLSADQIRQVAHLARLELRADEVDHYAGQLSRILEMVSQLTAADTQGVAPMAHPLAMVQRLRPDEVTEPNRREDYQAHAPAVQDGLFIVPKVIE